MNDAIPRPQAKTRKALTPLLEIRNLTKSYDGQHAVDDVSLTIYKGEIFALLGASGCGKSTLLRMLAGFEQPSAGQIMLDGVDLSQVPPYLRPINMMFQSYALFPHMTVEQNIAFGLKQDKLPKAEIASRVNEMLGLVHMQEFAKRKPHQLSGGQRQRVALARSLAKRPKLLLLDEPMGALDKKLRDRMQLEVVDILERVGVTCVMVTHDQEEAMTMAGRIAIMNRGKFVQIGEPEEIYEHPTTRYSAEFIGSVNVFEGVLKERQEDGLVLYSPGLVHPLKVDADASVVDNVPVHVALRPEKIMLCEEPPANGCNFAAQPKPFKLWLSQLQMKHGRKLVIALPYIWLILLFLLPFLIVFKISLAEMARAIPPYTELMEWADGQLSITLNLGNFLQLTDDPLYFDAYLQSLQVAAISTICCLLIGYPLAWAVAHSKPSTRNILLLLVILPSWTSFLIRVYAWMGILKNNGVLNNFLLWLGIIDQPLTILHTNFAVYIGIVYAYVPFMVLPIYTALIRIDYSLVEAALDLGARPLKTFFTVIVPLTKGGIIAGSMLVFIPAVGEFVIPELLGGPDSIMIGRVLWQEFFNNRDWPVASAVAIVMLLLLIMPIMWFHKHQQKSEGEHG